MMKRILGFLLAACFALTCMGGALAEQTEPAAYTYNPGDITNAMFENLPSGTMSAIDMQLFMAFGESFADENYVAAEDLAAISEVLANSTLHMSAGAYDDGVRLYLAGLYGFGESAITVDAALNITETGLSLESNLIEGRKVTVTWDTLLRMLGLDDETLAALKSLSELTEEDVTTALTNLFDELSVYLQKAAEIASPYLEKVAEFAASLPVETLENVTEDSGYPAAARVVTITCTDKAIGELLVSLADMLEQDAVLAPILDQMIAGGMDITYNGLSATNTAEACALLRTAVAEELTDESRPIQLVLGTDESGMNTYLILYKETEDGGAVALTATTMQPDDSSFAFALSAGTHLADGSMEDGFTINATASIDASKPGAELVTTNMVFFEGGEVITQQTQKVSVALTEEDGVPMQTLDYALSQTQDGAVLDMTLSGSANPNEDGGEDMLYTGTMTVSTQASTVKLDLGYALVSAVVNGEPTADMVVNVGAPDLGLDGYGMTASCYTYEYDPATTAALEEYSLDTMSNDDMDVLTTQASTAAQKLLTRLMQALPEQIVAAMSE